MAEFERNAASANCIGKLAQIEVQLVMQRLDIINRLRLARCCHYTLHCAKHSFAWERGPLWKVLPCELERHSSLAVSVAATEAPFILPDHIRRSLLRFAPICLCCDFKPHAAQVGSLNLRAIHVRSTGGASTMIDYDWPAFLFHPRMQQLTECRLDGRSVILTASLVSALVSLPRIRTLSICCPSRSDTEKQTLGPPEAIDRLLTPIVSIPSLSDLTCTLSRYSYQPMCDAVWQRLRQLRRLSLLGAELCEDDFCSLLCSSTLQSLSLHRSRMIQTPKVCAASHSQAHRRVSCLHEVRMEYSSIELSADLMQMLLDLPQLRILGIVCSEEPPVSPFRVSALTSFTFSASPDIFSPRPLPPAFLALRCSRVTFVHVQFTSTSMRSLLHSSLGRSLQNLVLRHCSWIHSDSIGDRAARSESTVADTAGARFDLPPCRIRSASIRVGLGSSADMLRELASIPGLRSLHIRMHEPDRLHVPLLHSLLQSAPLLKIKLCQLGPIPSVAPHAQSSAKRKSRERWYTHLRALPRFRVITEEHNALTSSSNSSSDDSTDDDDDSSVVHPTAPGTKNTRKRKNNLISRTRAAEIASAKMS